MDNQPGLISFSQAVSETINLIKTNLQTYLVLGAVFAVISAVMALVTKNVGFPLVILIVILQLALSLLLTGALLHLTFKVGNGQSATFQEALNVAVEKFFSLIWVNILAGAIILGGTILLIIPGLIFAVWFFAVDYVLFDKNIGGWNALMESKRLVKGHFWGIVVLALGAIVIAIIIGIIFGIIEGIINLPGLSDFLSGFFAIPSVVYGYVIYRSLTKISGQTSAPASTPTPVTPSAT